MNKISLSSRFEENTKKPSDMCFKEIEIKGVVHELKNQACILNLGIATLRFPARCEDERQGHLAALQIVIGEMNLQFQRLDDWLLRTEHRRRSAKHHRSMSGGGQKKRPDWPLEFPHGQVSLNDPSSSQAPAFDDETR